MKMQNNEILTSLGNINKLPTGLQKMVKLGYKKVLNFGCGLGYINHTAMLKEQIELINYDPYIKEISEIKDTENIDAVVCNNVLNVIEDNQILINVIETLISFNKTVHITIYEGDRTGTGRKTTKGTYQRNTKSKDYEILSKYGFIFKGGMWTRKI